MKTRSISSKIGNFSILVFVLFTLIAMTSMVSYGAQANDKEMTLVLASYVPVNYPYIGSGQQVFSR